MSSKYGNLRGRFPKGSRSTNPLFGSGSGLSGSPLVAAMRRRTSEVRAYSKRRAGRGRQIKSLDQALRSCHASKGVVLREGGTNTLSRTQMPRGSAKLPAYVLATQPYSYVVNSGYQGTAGIGVQTLFGLTVLNHTDMAACFSGLNANYQTASKIFVESMEASLIFSNQSVASAICTIYDCYAKRDLSTSGVSTPGVAWATGLSNEGGTGSSYGTIGSQPWESDDFNLYWGIAKTTRVDIAAGDTHKHSVHWELNKVLHQEVVTNSAYGVEHMTYGCMVVFHGQPAHDSTTKTSVTTAPINLDVVQGASIRYKQLNNSSAIFTRSNGLATSFAVGEECFNEAVGQLQNATGLVPGTLNA